MASTSRFVNLSEDDISTFCDEQENKNTAKKTAYDIGIFKEFLAIYNSTEDREIQDIPQEELQPIIKNFILSVRKQNGKEYEPSSVKAFVQSIDRYLRKTHYAFSVLNDRVFYDVQETLEKKQKQLKSLGQGNRPNAAEPLSDEDINYFYDRKVLGTNSPRALLNTVWLNNCIHFGMRPGKEQRDLRWGDLELKQDSEGTRFIEFCRERQTKTRTGENPRNLRSKKPQMYENKSNPDRCPINSYLAYRARRPAGMLADESPFYLAVNIEVPKSEEQQWYHALKFQSVVTPNGMIANLYGPVGKCIFQVFLPGISFSTCTMPVKNSSCNVWIKNFILFVFYICRGGKNMMLACFESQG